MAVKLSSRDEHVWITWTALAGMAAAAVMALWGLPPVDLHGLLHRLGVMDPLCGGTRSAMYTARGDLALAWTYNPLGIAAVAAGILFSVRAAIGQLSGRWLALDLALSRRAQRFVVLVGVVLLSALEWRQQTRADLLIAPY
ncbi:DUF2752 domain-containing protein [Knoellia sp. DB2414S]|uniref:DUF2752 domain-containing protein n=1 Tax=Knoellia koreensis TaxID=2730921 RepID=A0A849HTF3_9MICO|nr:DUF2752 domain-containing protein [Knoellia sp. DB2414S]